MKLTPNWKSTLTGAWSIRLLILAAVISVLPVFITLVSPDLLGLDPLFFATIAARRESDRHPGAGSGAAHLQPLGPIPTR